MDIKATVLRRSITWQYHTTISNTLHVMGRKNRLMEADLVEAWWMTSLTQKAWWQHWGEVGGGGGMEACKWGGDHWSLQGRRKCLLYEQLVKVLINGVFPRAASLYVATVLKLLIINSPKGPKLILYSHKALMQGEVGANGTLGKQTSGRREATARCRCSDRQERQRTDRHTDTGRRGEGEDQNENKPLWVMRHHQKASKSMKGRHAKASRDFGWYGTQTMEMEQQQQQQTLPISQRWDRR